MFLVSTRSPRRVEYFSYLPDEIRRSDFRASENKVKRIIKIKITSLTSRTLCLSNVPCQTFVFSFFFFSSGTHMSFFIPLLGPFKPRNNLFCPGFNFLILIEYSLNIFHFSKFFKNPVFRSLHSLSRNS